MLHVHITATCLFAAQVLVITRQTLCVKIAHINSAIRALERNDPSVGQNGNGLNVDENGNHMEIKWKQKRNGTELPVLLYGR